MELILAVACDKAHVLPDGRVRDILGVFNELYAPGFPAQQDHMTVVFVVQWGRDESGRIPLRVDLVDDAEKKILTIQGHTEVEHRTAERAPAQTHLVLPLDEVRFPHPGAYHFRLKAGNSEQHALSIFLGERPEDQS